MKMWLTITRRPGWTQNCKEAKAQIDLFCERLRHFNVSVICWLKFPKSHKKMHDITGRLCETQNQGFFETIGWNPVIIFAKLFSPDPVRQR